MGNTGSGSSRSRRHRSYQTSQPTQPPQSEITGSNLIFGASTPYSSQYPHPSPPQYYQYHGYYPPQPVPVPYPQPYRGGGVYPHPGPAHANWVAGQYPCGAGFAQPEPYVEHQKAVTIRNDVNVKKDTLQLDPDEENPGSFLVAFTFDATASGSITVMFFAKEEEDSNFIVTKESLLKPVTVNFQQGLGQKFRQPSGTGINFSMFDEIELLKGGNTEVFPVMVKAEACPANQGEHEPNANSSGNSQITLAVFKKDKGEYQMRVTKQILWVNKMRYELQEIYGIGNAVDGDLDENDSGKECVICLSEPRDTTVLPCRHMCMCSGCAKVLRFQTDRCPICRQPVERLLEIKVNIGPDN